MRDTAHNIVLTYRPWMRRITGFRNADVGRYSSPFVTVENSHGPNGHMLTTPSVPGTPSASSHETARLTPPVAIDCHYLPDVTARVTRELHLPPPGLDTDPERVLWTTIGLLLDAILEGR